MFEIFLEFPLYPLNSENSAELSQFQIVCIWLHLQFVKRVALKKSHEI